MVNKQSIKTFIARFYILFILLLMYAPILVLAVYSFTVSDQLGVWSGFSFQLYVDLVENKPLMSAVKNTVLIALVSAFCSTILGTIGASFSA
jgi:spermidine/putrescine transport system permease protein